MERSEWTVGEPGTICCRALPLSVAVHARPSSDASVGSPFGSQGSPVLEAAPAPLRVYSRGRAFHSLQAVTLERDSFHS